MNLNKEYRGTDYPRSRATGIPARQLSFWRVSPFPFWPEGQKPPRKFSGLYFTSPGTAKEHSDLVHSSRGRSSDARGEMNRKPRPKGRGIYRLNRNLH